MDNILILTERTDAHARAVVECLIQKGAKPIRLFPKEFILDLKINQTIYQNGEHCILIKDGQESCIDLSEIDVVWYRRVHYPLLPCTIDANDLQFVAAENRHYVKSLWLTLGESARWVNPFTSFDKANSKVFQLKVATSIGLKIPDTLISNDRQEIVKFIEHNGSLGTIYKTFSPAIWEEGDTFVSHYTTEIHSNMLADEKVMSLTPGIYQQKMKKAYEIRVTFFGEEYVAVKIPNADKLDWRTSDETKLSPIIIPQEIERKCKLLMNKLGIVFGCFDFIVTPKDEYIFLEVNEMGQFLWIEKALPELHLLDKFCNFLLYTKSCKGTQGNVASIIKLNDIVETEAFKLVTHTDLKKHENIKNLSS